MLDLSKNKQDEHKVELNSIYSDVVIEILNDIWIQERLKRCHKLRADVGGLNIISDIRLVEASLNMYERSKKRILKNRTKKNKRKEAKRE